MSKLVPVKIKRLQADAVIPQYAHEGDAGFDLFTLEDTIILAGETKVCKTGIAMAIPKGYEVQIRPRSGISLNGVEVIFFPDDNHPVQRRAKCEVSVKLGTVDCKYRGDIGIIVKNESSENIIIPKRTKLAQAVLNEVPQAKFEIVDELDETDRGQNGFGSTGVR